MNQENLINSAGVGGSLLSSALNYRSQRKTLEYQKGIQKQIFKREDNAMQRKVQDLEKAGLHRTLAAGAGSAAGNIAPVKAPQIDANASEITQNVLSKKLMGAQIKAQNMLAEKTAQEIANMKHNFDVAKDMEQPIGAPGDKFIQYIRAIKGGADKVQQKMDKKGETEYRKYLQSLGIKKHQIEQGRKK